MLQLIALIILLGSFVGISVMLFKKVPLLIELPVAESVGIGLFSKLKKRIKQLKRFSYFSVEAILQKVLLQTEKRANFWSTKLKQRAEKRDLSDDYWCKLKISTRSSSLSSRKRTVRKSVKSKPRAKTKVRKTSRKVKKSDTPG